MCIHEWGVYAGVNLISGVRFEGVRLIQDAIVSSELHLTVVFDVVSALGLAVGVASPGFKTAKRYVHFIPINKN